MINYHKKVITDGCLGLLLSYFLNGKTILISDNEKSSVKLNTLILSMKIQGFFALHCTDMSLPKTAQSQRR